MPPDINGQYATRNDGSHISPDAPTTKPYPSPEQERAFVRGSTTKPYPSPEQERAFVRGSTTKPYPSPEQERAFVRRSTIAPKS